MTGDWGQRPEPRIWTRPSPEATQPAAPHASPSWTGNGVMAEVRERVRALETLVPMLEQMASERTATQARRVDGIDQRLAAGDRRMDRLDQRLTATEQAAAPLPGIEARVSHIERRWAAWKAGLQYASAALVIGLVLAGKMTLGQAAALLKLLVPFSPG
jgi:hypothetical protein